MTKRFSNATVAFMTINLFLHVGPRWPYAMVAALVLSWSSILALKFWKLRLFDCQQAARPALSIVVQEQAEYPSPSDTEGQSQAEHPFPSFASEGQSHSVDLEEQTRQHSDSCDGVEKLALQAVCKDQQRPDADRHKIIEGAGVERHEDRELLELLESNDIEEAVILTLSAKLQTGPWKDK